MSTIKFEGKVKYEIIDSGKSEKTETKNKEE